MIAAIHLGRGFVAIPQFPDGRRTILRHIAPRGVGLGGCQAIGHVSKTVIRETSHQPRDANDTARHVVLILDADIFYYVLDDVVLAAIRHDTYR